MRLRPQEIRPMRIQSLLFAAALLIAVPATAQAQASMHGSQRVEFRRDTREIRGDRREMRRDHRELRSDRRDARADGTITTSERRELRGDKREMRQGKHELKRDRRDRRRDARDFRAEGRTEGHVHRSTRP